MNFVLEILEEQIKLLTDEMRFVEGEELKETEQRLSECVEAVKKLNIPHVSVSLPSDLRIYDFAYDLYNSVEGDYELTSLIKGMEFIRDLIDKGNER